MSRTLGGHAWRPGAVWLAASVAAGPAVLAVPAAWRSVGPWSSAGVDDLLVAVCTTGLAAALAWLWALTTATVVGLARGRTPSAARGVRRLVLLACGTVVLAGVGAPAVAADGAGAELLAGLTLPERAVAPAAVPSRTAPAAATQPAAGDTYVVRAGDSLWAIARSHPRSGAPVERRWREIWHANRHVVGDDPDLILPGQELRLTGTDHLESHQSHHENGDR